MPVPAAVPRVTLTGNYTVPASGAAELAGTLTFTPIPSRLASVEHGVIMLGSDNATLNASGGFSISLVATDAADEAFVWRVDENITGLTPASYNISLPASGSPVALASVVETEELPDTYTVITGPQGPQGAAGSEANAQAYTDAAVTAEVQRADSAYDPAGSASTATATAATDATTKVSAHAAANDPHGDRAYADSTFLPQAVVTVDDLMASDPFYISHRGSGGEHPEHTLIAYDAAVAAGVKAIEVSVHTTADGVPVCFHDTTLDRMTDWTGPISSWTYAALRQRVKIQGWELLGSGWADQDIPTLREVLDRFYGRVVIFLEAKSSASVVPVQTMLSQYPGANQSVVWKMYYTNNSAPWAQANGYTVWGYVDAGTTDEQMNAVDANIDVWGVPHTMTDQRMIDVLNRPGGKKAICWEVHRRSEVTRLRNLTGTGTLKSIHGLMSSQYVYLAKTLPLLSRDNFTSQVKAPGDLPITNYDSGAALKYDNDGSGGAYINVVPNMGHLLGSISDDTPPTSYRIKFDMKWEALPGASLHSGVAFGKLSDDKYSFSTANATGGYHMLLRGNGDMQLYTHAPGVTAGTQLGTVATTAPVGDMWMSFEVDVTPTQVILRRTDVEPDVTLTVSNTTYRGGFIHLHVGSVDNLANKPHWRNVEVVAL